MKRIVQIFVVLLISGCATHYRLQKNAYQFDGVIAFEGMGNRSYVFIDGKPAQVTGASTFTVPLKRGAHKIEIFSGNERRVFFVEIERGSFVKISAGSH